MTINSLGLIRTVIVDNDQSELDQLVMGMHAAHIPALPLLYSVDTGIVNAPPSSRLSVRLLFVDMNLADASTPSAKDIASTIADVIPNVIKSGNGPYALIFWSKHAHLVQEVLEILGNRHSDISMPIVTGALDKNDFKTREDSDTQDIRLQRLSEAITNIVNTSPQLTSLMTWEHEIATAASATLAALTKIIQCHEHWNVQEYASNIGEVLARIALEATGRKSAEAMPEQAIHLGLQPLLVDNLERNSSIAANRDQWKLAMPALTGRQPILANDVANRRLNTFYCISKVIQHTEKVDRGVFVEISSDHISDENFSRVFGKTCSCLADEFVNVSGIDKAEKKKVRDSLRWGLIELSPDCDHAQKKSRLYRFMLAALVPNKAPERTQFTNIDGLVSDRKHTAIYRMPVVEIEDDEPAVLFVNYRYLLGLPIDAPILGNVLFRLRNPILGELIHNYSKYVARPGIVSFSN